MHEITQVLLGRKVSDTVFRPARVVAAARCQGDRSLVDDDLLFVAGLPYLHLLR